MADETSSLPAPKKGGWLREHLWEMIGALAAVVLVILYLRNRGSSTSVVSPGSSTGGGGGGNPGAGNGQPVISPPDASSGSPLNGNPSTPLGILDTSGQFAKHLSALTGAGTNSNFLTVDDLRVGLKQAGVDASGFTPQQVVSGWLDYVTKNNNYNPAFAEVIYAPFQSGSAASPVTVNNNSVHPIVQPSTQLAGV